MSVKRQATTELNHENWNLEDPSEREEMGTFKPAAKEVLEKRVIRTAKRRSQLTNDEGKKNSAFSGFGGFNQTQPSSFDFLATLTNGSQNTNGSTSNNETSGTSSLFSSKPANSSGGLFSMSSTPPKSTLGSTMIQTSPFGAAKAEGTTTNDSPFKIQPTVSPADNKTEVASKIFSISKESPFKINVSESSNDIHPNPASSTQKSSPFGTSSANENKSLFSSSTNSSPFKIQPVSSTSTMVQTSFGITPKLAATSNEPEKKDDSNNDKKMKYYAKLKGLNESVSDWIKKHVEQTPLCILSPIFKDYEKYLIEIQEEYQSSKEETNKNSTESKSEAKPDVAPLKTPSFGVNNTGASVFSSSPSNSKPSVFGGPNDDATGEKPSFSFGIKSNNSEAPTTVASTGFSFGATTTASNMSSPFSLTSTATTNQSSTPFSFGIGQPFSFSPSNVQQSTEATKIEKEDEDEPPKVEYTPVVEENSVYDKKCKIFVKKDGNFVDRGVGTLYVKKIEESGKHQLLVRANTNLGTVLLNLILASAIPTQRMGKNNVMLVCIPTPDAKPPPTPVLIRVKTTEEANELLEMLNKYKT